MNDQRPVDRNANDALIESQTQLSSLINSTSDLIWSVDAEQFGLLLFNRALEDYFFQNRGLHICTGMRPEDLFPPGQYVECWHDFYRKAMREGAYSLEYLVYSGTRTLELNFNPLLRDGVIFGISVFGKDITVQKAAEFELQRSETKFRTLFNSTSDAVMLLDSDGFIDCNEATLAVYRCSSKEIFCAMHPADMSPPVQPCGTDSRTLANRWIDAAWNTRSLRFEWLHQKLDTGEVFPAEVLLSPMDLNGRPVLQAVVRDISERKDAENEQKRLQRALRLLSDCNISLAQARDEKALLATICRLVVETGGYLLSWIGFAEQDAEKTVRPVAQFGKSDGFIENIRVSWDETQDIGQGGVGTAIRSGRTQIIQNLLKNPKMRPWQQAAQERGYQATIMLPLKCQHEVIGTLIICSSDPHAFVAEEVTLLEELAGNFSFGIESLRIGIQRDTAEEASRAKSAFLASMSHELRTPLNAIIGFAQMLEMGYPVPIDPAQREPVRHILDSGRHLLHLINDVLDLTRIEADKVDLSIGVMALAPIVDEAIRSTGPSAGQRQINICNGGMAGLNVLADAARVRQIMLNLLSNAIKYNRDGGTVIVSAEVRGELVRVSIADTGPGIPAALHAQLFQPFQRLGADRTAIEGTGIGLVVCKKLVEAMGGSIGFHSQVGVGSRFWFELPLSNLSTVSAKPLASKPAGTPSIFDQSLTGKVLCIEDNPVNMLVMKHIFMQLPKVSFLTADNAEAGLALISQQLPDLVLMDVNLPGMSGLEALQQIKSNLLTAAIPVVAVSAAVLPNDVRNGLEAGFCAYLSKPFEVPDLIELVSGTLRKEV